MPPLVSSVSVCALLWSSAALGTARPLEAQTSASLQAQVRIVDGTRLQARQVGDVRLVTREREHDEYALTVQIASSVPWQLAIAASDAAPRGPRGDEPTGMNGGTAGEVMGILSARDARGVWRPLDSTRTPTVVEQGIGTGDPQRVVIHFRVSGRGRLAAFPRPRLLLSPRSD